MTNGIIVIMALLVLLIGALLAATPSLMPATECFAVTIPPSAQADPRIKALRRSYAWGVAVVTIASALGLTAFAGVMDLSASDASVRLSTAVCIATFAPLVAATTLMLRNRSQIRSIKQDEGWGASGTHAAAMVGTEDGTGPISLWWNLLYLPLILGFTIVGMHLYDQLPEQIPMQIGLDGTIERSVPKSPASVLYPIAIIGFLASVMTLSHWMVSRSKRPVDPAAPATSALAYGAFARMQTIVLLAGGLAISIAVGASYYLSALGIVSLGMSAVLISLAAVGFAGAEAWTAVVLGQSGAKLAAQLRANDEVARDDDAHWLLGMIYWNPDDPSIIVPKRFGVGWTLNAGRPAAWALVALVVGVAVGFACITESMIG